MRAGLAPSVALSLRVIGAAGRDAAEVFLSREVVLQALEAAPRLQHLVRDEALGDAIVRVRLEPGALDGGAALGAGSVSVHRFSIRGNAQDWRIIPWCRQNSRQ